MRMILRVFLVLGVVFGLCGCSLMPVEPVPDRTPLPIPEDARPSPITFSRLKIEIPRGTETAALSPRDFGLRCRGPYGKISRREILKQIDNAELYDSFHKALEAQGYDLTGNPALLFDLDDDYARTRYKIGASLIDFKMDLCLRTSLLFNVNQGFLGEASVKIRWSVYDALRRYTVMDLETEGYARQRLPNVEGAGLLLDMAFEAASHNLGADPEFHALVVEGKRPVKSLIDLPYSDPDLEDGPMILPSRPLYEGDIHPRLDQVRKIAVMIETGYGHGSGFFISPDYILTNAHVAGFADQVRVLTAGRKRKVIARVVRRHRLRDVALIRLEEPLKTPPEIARLRPEIPNVGDDVYVVGAPLWSKDMQDTVTKGIVSAYRPASRRDPLSYIQADADTHPGNSGGPMMDGAGNVIGIAVAGMTDGTGKSASGLNLFIPISEALSVMDIELE